MRMRKILVSAVAAVMVAGGVSAVVAPAATAVVPGAAPAVVPAAAPGTTPAGVPAVVPAAAPAVHGGSDRSGSDPSGAVCQKRRSPIVVQEPTRVDGQWVDPGTYAVYQEGISCADAIGLVEGWLEDGRTGGGFTQYDDSDAGKGDVVLDPCEHLFVDRKDTGTRLDNDAVKLVPLTCDPQDGQTDEVRKFRGLSGSTVAIVNGQSTALDAWFTTPSLARRTLTTSGANSVYEGSSRGSAFDPSGTDVRSQVRNGSSDQGVQVVATSTFANHIIAVFDRAGVHRLCEYMLNVGASRTCTFTNESYTLTRIDNDTRFSPARYRYRVAINFSAQPSGSTVRVISNNATPMAVTTTQGSGANGTLARGATLTATGYTPGASYDVGVTVTDGADYQVKIQTYSSRIDHKVEVYLNGEYGLLLIPACTWSVLRVNETRTCEENDANNLGRPQTSSYTVKRIADDLTPRPNSSSNRYQYEFTINFSDKPLGSTINLTNGGSRPGYVSILRGDSGTSGDLPPGGTLTSSRVPKFDVFDVELCFLGPGWVLGRRSNLYNCVGSVGIQYGVDVSTFNGREFIIEIGGPGDVSRTLSVGEILRTRNDTWDVLVTRVANDLTPRPGSSSNRYQYNVTARFIG